MTQLRLLLVLLLAVLSGCGDSGSGDGPIEGGKAARFGQPVDVGESVSMSHVRLRNLGDEPAVIEQVRMLGVTGPFEFLGVMGLRLPDDGEHFIGGFRTGFPTHELRARPLSEVPVPVQDGDEGKSLQLVVGVRVTGPGVARASGAEITYRIGDKQYRETFEDEVYLCAPAADYTEGCAGAGGEGFDDRTVVWSAKAHPDGLVQQQ